MFIGSERCISTTLRRSKRRLQARRDKRLGRIADFLRLMTRAFKCSFSTTGNFEPIPLCSSRRARGQNGGKKAGGALYTAAKSKKKTRGCSDGGKKKKFCSFTSARANTYEWW